MTNESCNVKNTNPALVKIRVKGKVGQTIVHESASIKTRMRWHLWCHWNSSILITYLLINKICDVVMHCFFFRYACSIEMPEMFILTGGYSTLKTVSRYKTSGWMEDLPKLNEGRRDHGCGYFYDDDMQRVRKDIQLRWNNYPTNVN